MTPADYFILGFTSAVAVAAALVWHALEKTAALERRRWQRQPLLTEQEIVDRATRRRL